MGAGASVGSGERCWQSPCVARGDARLPATTPAAAAPDLAVLSTLKWRNVGPARGGRSITAAGSAARPLEYYFGATGGGLWKTTDGGLTWSAVGDGQFKTSSVGAVAVAPSNPDVVYVGFGRGAAARQHHPGRRRVQVDRRRQDLLVGRPRGDAQPSAASACIRPTRTSSGSRRSASRMPGRRSRRLQVHRRRQDVEEGAVPRRRHRRGGSRDRPGESGHPLRRRSGRCRARRTRCRVAARAAASSSPSTAAPPGPRSRAVPACRTGLLGKIGVSVSGADGNRVYAIIEAADGGLFSTDDGGANWTRVNDDRNIRQRALYYTRIYADPKARDTRLRPQRAVPQVDRRRQDVQADSRAARRQPRPLDRARQSAADGPGQRRRRQRLHQRRPVVDRPGTTRRRSSTTRSRRATRRT